MSLARGERETLPSKRRQVSYTLALKGRRDRRKLHVSFGLSWDGRVVELFVAAQKTGSELRTTMEVWAITASLGLQHGWPVREFARSMRGQKLERVMIECQDVPAIHGKAATSPWDAIAQLIEAETNERGEIT